MSQDIDVAIVGAGPYGLSIAAQLAHRGVEHRVLGNPMQFWLTQMPKGMLLKSEGFASSLYDAEGRYTYGRYCAEEGLPYADLGLPVPLETFCRYGLAFQRRAVPTLENKSVVAVERSANGFTLRLDDGEAFMARRVVVAVGVGHFSHMPRELDELPPELASHSSAHHDLARFKGSDVTVLGGGSSAIDLAALLHEAGAKVRLVARKAQLEIHTRMRLPRPLGDRLREPLSSIGPSWRSCFFTGAPLGFYHLPAARRLRLVRNHLGPAGGWFMADRFGRVPLLLGHTLRAAQVAGSRARLQLAASDGSEVVLKTDHVIAATGYRPDLGRLDFLAPELRTAVAALRRTTPLLSTHFQSSVPGLYFAGPITANSFGPVMRFAAGAKFTAGRISRHLAGRRFERPIPTIFDWPWRSAAAAR
jgi:thioredoxin reductase